MVDLHYSLRVNHALGTALLAAAGCLTLYCYIRPGLQNPQLKPRIIQRALRPADGSQTKIQSEEDSTVELSNSAYPPDVFPGGRNVDSVYGTIKVFEWGPEEGEKVLLLHGIGTPCVALGNMAKRLVERGYRVMLFDLFGRGYSDAPTDIPFDDRLYTTQILLVLASSPLAWTGTSAFHLLGFSLGGCIAGAFAAYHPHMLKSVAIACGGSILREEHMNWKTRIIYSEDVLPYWLSRWLVKRRIEPKKAGADTLGEGKDPAFSFDDTVCFEVDHPEGNGKKRGVTVGEVVRWQMETNEGAVDAYLKTMRSSPIYGHHDGIWKNFADALRKRRNIPEGQVAPPGLKGGVVSVILGSEDPVVRMNEFVEDINRVMGEDGVEISVIEAGHEAPISRGREVSDITIKLWEARASA